MSSSQIREELHQFINRADDRVLVLLYGMMKADNEGTLTLEQQQELDRRVDRHRKNESKSFTIDEARTIIEKKRA